MRLPTIQTAALACATLVLAAAPALAQTSGLGGSSVGGGGSFGTSMGSSGLGGSSLGSSGLGGSSLGSGSGGFGSSSSSGLGGFGFGTSSSGGTTGVGGASGTGAAGGRTGTTKIGSTSFQGAYFINPLALGLASGNTSAAFGSPLYTVTTTTTGTASINTQNATANGFGAGFGIRRLPAYATTIKFAVPPPPPPAQVRFDLQNMLAQTTQLDPRDAVRITMDGRAVVLRGHVVDDDERRLVENMILLTPGVYQVRNELSAGR